MDPGHPNLVGRRGDGTRQRQDGTQTCKATCQPNAGEEGGNCGQCKMERGEWEGHGTAGKASRPRNEQFQPDQIDDLQQKFNHKQSLIIHL